MTQPDDATRRQLEAARPDRSTWLSANAGSGKTRVLTDRVARLLLDGVQPQHILCLTYTKAAASEMQNRLFVRLGAWAMLDDDALRTALADLGVAGGFDPEALRLARTLFARAIETPGGLKIQTIHSFCGALLRRFPLEAGVSPQFVEIEERAAEMLRSELLDEMADGVDAVVVKDLATLNPYGDHLKLTRDIVQHQRGFSSDFDRGRMLRALGHPEDLTPDKILGDVMEHDGLDLIHAISDMLAEGGKIDNKASATLRRISVLDNSALPLLEDAFLTKSGTRRASTASKNAAAANPDLMPKLETLMDRTETARDARLALETVENSAVLHRFAERFLNRYRNAKQQRGWLDFDDLIEHARSLLSDTRVAAWVLFRIDGGIDHILVDEAQDTSPGQWDVIRKLSEEFAAGQGARSDVARTIFVVGDQKQSIYSFQGADPKAFDAMRTEFGDRLRNTESPLQQTALQYSFRSSPAILHLVDNVFESEAGTTFPTTAGHIAFQDAMPGRVDVWPFVPTSEKEEPGAWFDAVDRKTSAHHHRILACQVAERIQDMLGNEHIPTHVEQGSVYARKIQPRDILILVRRRTGIFQDIIRACKEAQLPIAGADRLRVGAEVAVKDLRALLSFLATSDDDLSLAVALRSPILGWSEQDLFTLAHGRGKQTLWTALRNKHEAYPRTLEILYDLRSKVDYLRPYDLIERVLTRHEGRKRMLGRLGNEAQDGIDAFLSQALAYEQTSVPSLTGFLVWMETDDLTIKRQVDSASNQIRIMTVHGSKGLEAPIVILPECEARQHKDYGTLAVCDEQVTWKSNKEGRPAGLATIAEERRKAAEEESLRLFYVALTRAEKWLIVSGSGSIDEKSGTDWYSRTRQAAVDCGATEIENDQGLRLEYGNWSNMIPKEALDTEPHRTILEPIFTQAAPAPTARKATVSPSELSGPKALPGEGFDEATALRFGTYIHLLFERLPHMSPQAQLTFAEAEAQRAGLSDDMAHLALAEASQVLHTEAFAHLFEPSVLSEVSITAPLGTHRLHGTIDRLVVSETEVLAVDFKSNRQVPSHVSECPSGLLRQMGAYAHALAQIYPGKTVKTAILWTVAPKLMPLPHEMVTSALGDTLYLDVTGRPT